MREQWGAASRNRPGRVKGREALVPVAGGLVPEHL